MSDNDDTTLRDTPASHIAEEEEENNANTSNSNRKRPVPTEEIMSSSNKAASHRESSAKLGGGPSEKKRKTKSSPGSNGSTGGDSKANRGLRHFSMMVCKKVEEKGTTTYNEVADELVRKVIDERRKEDPDGKFDEKNIRRRVYDALNVLMAMDIISKEKKEITWKGLPRSSNAHQDLDSLDVEVEFRKSQVARKKEALRELLVQQVCFRNLALHNRERGPSDEKIPLPFIVVNTNASAVIQCDMSRDRTDVMFDFSMPFEINDDNTILKKMGMDKTAMSVLKQMMPEDMMSYCQDHGLLDNLIGKDGGPNHAQEHLNHPSSASYHPHYSAAPAAAPPPHHHRGPHAGHTAVAPPSSQGAQRSHHRGGERPPPPAHHHAPSSSSRHGPPPPSDYAHHHHPEDPYHRRGPPPPGASRHHPHPAHRMSDPHSHAAHPMSGNRGRGDAYGGTGGGPYDRMVH